MSLFRGDGEGGRPRRARLTWRARAALAVQLVDQGEYVWAKLRGIALAAAAVKILVPSLSTEFLLALAPVALVAQAVTGWVWVRWALYREMQEVALADAWLPKDLWAIWMQVHTLERLGINPADFNPRELPEVYRRVVLASTKEGK